jgi:hypothetical protein
LILLRSNVGFSRVESSNPIVEFGLIFCLLLFFCFSKVGRKIAALVKKVTAGSVNVPFKTDELTWGVTDGNSERLTLRSFGNYKSPTRLDAEVALSAYLTDFSEPRYKGGNQSFAIATAVAPPGTGKSRLLDAAKSLPRCATARLCECLTRATYCCLRSHSVAARRRRVFTMWRRAVCSSFSAASQRLTATPANRVAGELRAPRKSIDGLERLLEWRW